MNELVLVIVVVILALVFDYVNGFHDTANAIATSVSTRALSPNVAVIMAALANFAGAMYSTGVAVTIGSSIVASAELISQTAIIAALIAAIFWNILTWGFGLPSSSSHALIGGLIGAVLYGTGLHGLNFNGIMHIFASLVFSPLIALVTGVLVMILFLWIFGRMTPSKINARFLRIQVLAAAMMAFANGSNDAQKSMGIMTLALLVAGFIPVMEVPFWVKFSAAMAMALGTATGGWRIIKTVGGKICKLEPMSGFAADLNSASVVFGATLLNLPVSTTHVVSGSIMGVGSAKRFNAVHWGVARRMLVTWVVTIPCSACVAAVCYFLLKLIGN